MGDESAVIGSRRGSGVCCLTGRVNQGGWFDGGTNAALSGLGFWGGSHRRPRSEALLAAGY
jgi:hypothetical protein